MHICAYDGERVKVTFMDVYKLKLILLHFKVQL